MREEIGHEESRYHYLKTMKEILEVQQVKVNDEMKSYVSSDPQDKKKSLRYAIGKSIGHVSDYHCSIDQDHVYRIAINLV